MAIAPIDAQQTTLTVNSVLVGGIVSFSGFDGEAADVNITTLDSTAKEFRQGLQDFGNFSIELVVDPDDLGQAELDAQKAAQTTSTCVLTYPDTVTLNVYTFSAYVKSFSNAGGVDDVVKGTANLRITGAVVKSDETP